MFSKSLEKNKRKSPIKTNHFSKEYAEISNQLIKLQVDTARTDSLKRLNEGIIQIKQDESLSDDAKIVALLDVFVSEYALVLKSFGGSSSGVAKFMRQFCAENLGVELGLGSTYRIKPDGLIMRVLNDQGIKYPEQDSLLPPIHRREAEVGRVSKSASVLEVREAPKPKVSPSLNSIETAREEVGQFTLRKNKELTRLGSMFGAKQFCYGEKPSGVEPGFRAIDLDELFFKELDKILAEGRLPAAKQVSDVQKLKDLREALSKEEDLNQKQIVFATFISSQIKAPHAKGVMAPNIQWLCDEVKAAVAKNNQLSAWMYKLDYAEGQKDRIKANKEALREFVGTRFAGIFSAQNQRQEIVWVNNGKGEVHALLACGWKNGLQELTHFLHGGSAPDYNGVLVEDKSAAVKRSKYIYGLAKNLIFGIGIGDRDGMGKDAQNKGFADNAYYGFDYGKPYEGEGVASSLDDDFSFEDLFAKAPALFRGSSPIGLARHFMYRNYSVFYDTVLSERMEGVHLLIKMITGENPSEEVIKSYPGLRDELNRIEERTPSPEELLKNLGALREKSAKGSQLEALIDAQIIEICSGKLSTFDLYFAQIKIDLIDMGIKNKMPYAELADYIGFINEMEATARNSNQHILATFEQRKLLTAQEIDLLDRLEKYFSPTSVMSHDGEVFLNTMRFDPPSSRMPFQLKKEENGTYTLTTTNKNLIRQLKDEFGLECKQSEAGLSCTINADALAGLMKTAEMKYNQKRDGLLIKPTYKFITFTHMFSILNQNNTPQDPKVDLGFLWREDNSLSLRIIAKTRQQVVQAERLFGIKLALNEAQLIEIQPDAHAIFQKRIEKHYERFTKQEEGVELVEIGRRESIIPVLSQSKKEISPTASDKWKEFHEKSEAEIPETPSPTELLIERLNVLIPDEGTREKVLNIIEETDPKIIQQLLSYNDQTLSANDNLEAIMSEQFSKIHKIEDKPTVTASDPISMKQTLY
ncbi:Uncharacterised protein [Legionella steigerwaltii]|uniref:Uncharacterized protein n=1 Tax=Legionella steigerwaltii TaxID=460 RepID=A0A378LD33_9GAMM|nr:hypothetical protein [Legionella steigerwaltii]KTD71636.1 hypothetical protein Lstg_2844 [Legionella steigerwaltii]STY23788.1 Uncharacterised protein [Legionella steigerwaltii]